MGDEKKPPAFDSDKTVVDVRRPEPVKPSSDSGDKTVVAPVSRPAPAPADEDAGKTVVMTRPRPEAPKAPVADADKTIVAPARPVVGTAADAEKTVVRAAGAVAAPQVSSAFEVVSLSGQARGRRFPIAGGEALIGSNPSCQIVLSGIEGVHAKLVKRDEESFEVQNLGSKGSVLMAGRPVTRTKVRSGDLLKLGEVVVRLVRVGDVFSSDYSEAELAGSGIGRFLDPAFLKENPLYLAVGGLVVLVVFGLLFWPSSSPAPTVQQSAGPSASEDKRAKEVEAFLQQGEVLFNAGKLIAPPDQPEMENAFAKFNDVLALDPGNEKALAWLKKIDEERGKQRRAREEEDQRKLALERERRERERKELEGKVAKILADGDALFARGDVAEPAGRNALGRYREALQVDPQSAPAQERVQRAVQYYVDRGDRFRENNDPWSALENYRKASRATGGDDGDVESRVRETEARLRSGMTASDTPLVMYKDEHGQLFVVDELDKVPARFKDRAVVVQPSEASKR